MGWALTFTSLHAHSLECVFNQYVKPTDKPTATAKGIRFADSLPLLRRNETAILDLMCIELILKFPHSAERSKITYSDNF